MKPFMNSKLWRVLAVSFGGLFAVVLGGREIAVANSAALNNALNINLTTKNETDGYNPDYEYYKSDYKNSDGTYDEAKIKEYVTEVGKEVEREGLVLLKNENNALPLVKGDKVSLMGQGSVKTNYASSGSSSSDGTTFPDLTEVLSSTDYGLSLNPTTHDFYATGKGSKYGRKEYKMIKQINETPWSEYDDTTKDSLKTYNDAAIVVLARDSGEGSDVSAKGSDGEDGSYLSISQAERDLLTNLTTMKKSGTIKKVIVLLNMACPVETDFMFDSTIDVDALLWVGNLGTNGVYGMADVLLGKATPSGKLSDTFLRDNMSSPAMADWMLNKNSKFGVQFDNVKSYNGRVDVTQQYYGVYVEGIYLGYRYYETRYEDAILSQGNAGEYKYDDVVSYPFGYGLSYTSFSYSDFKVEEGSDGKTYDVSVKVTNTGDIYSGKEVVQVYLQKPYTSYDKENNIEKASVELVGFGKTSSLAPKDSEVVKVTVEKEEFKSYDANKAKTYILDEGKYYLTAATDAHSAVNNILKYKGAAVEGDASFVSVALDQKNLDTTTYSKSTETGKAITNELDEADMNKYSHRGNNSVQYVSRNDWTGTFPKAATIFNLNDDMVKDLQSHKEIKDSGETMPQYGKKDNLNLVELKSTEDNVIAFDDPKWDTLLDETTQDEQVLLLSNGGFHTDVMESINKPYSTEKDGPLGPVNTNLNNVMPSEAIWASTFDVDMVKKVGDAIAEDCLFAGVQGLYAPGVNLHRTPFGGRLNEYFSEDSFLTGMMAASEIQGMQNKGIIPAIKHYAFNEEECNRNGISNWLNEQEARELLLKPFEMATRPSKGNSHSLMSSFNRAGTTWTSAIKGLMEDILRDEFGFDGYVITDMADANGKTYMTYDDGFMNGTDLFLANGSASEFDSYKNNPAFAQAMRKSVHRILYVMANFSASMNQTSPATVVSKITPWWLVAINSLVIGAGVLTLAFVGLFIASYVLRIKAQN